MIQPATATHKHEVYALYSLCRSQLLAQGIPQWDDVYPSVENIEEDIQQGTLYLYLLNGVCAGAITLSEEQAEAYKSVEWKYTGGKILVVHRLATHPQYRRQGIASHLMDFAEAFALQNNYAAIRLDAYSDNPASLRLYENRGYKHSGTIFFPRRTKEFYCYEKSFLNTL